MRWKQGRARGVQWRVAALHCTLVSTSFLIRERWLALPCVPRSLLREIRYLRQCGPHPNIVQLYGSFRTQSIHLLLASLLAPVI
jgi:serine/threonine protein kinase